MAVQETTKPVDSYNYKKFARSETTNMSGHFKTQLRAGEEAPDFTLPTVEGGRVRLSDLRGKKHVLLEFGSIT